MYKFLISQLEFYKQTIRVSELFRKGQAMLASSMLSISAASCRLGFVLPTTKTALESPKAYGNTWQQRNDQARHRSIL